MKFISEILWTKWGISICLPHTCETSAHHPLLCSNLKHVITVCVPLRGVQESFYYDIFAQQQYCRIITIHCWIWIKRLENWTFEKVMESNAFYERCVPAKGNDW